MNRRNFIKTSALGALGMSLPTFGLSSCNNSVKSDAPVIIIGAGIAGLGAARALRKIGFTNVTILEARNRIGGRIWTDRSLGFPLDLGASWIHGPKGGNPIKALADSVGAETFMTDDEKLVVYNTDGTKIQDSVVDTYEKDYNTMLASIEKNGQQGQSLKDAVQAYNSSYLTDNIMKYHLSAYAEFDAGGPIESIDSKLWQEDSVFSGKDVIFPNGYEIIPALLAEGVDIRFNIAVNQIALTADGVRVTANSGDVFTGKYVICTAPLGVLKTGSITFSPALPADKQGAISRLRMGTVNKVGIVFPSIFWDNDQQYLGYCSDIKGQYPYFLNCNKFVKANLLMTFGLGNYALLMENQSTNQIGADIMSVLRKMYGNSIPNYTQIAVSRWTNDVFARGSYSYMNVGATGEDFDAFVAPVENKLFFAGEHTSRKYYGAAHGAYLSGLKQAEMIMELEDK
jgi:monoamine oxidase